MLELHREIYVMLYLNDKDWKFLLNFYFNSQSSRVVTLIVRWDLMPPKWLKSHHLNDSAYRHYNLKNSELVASGYRDSTKSFLLWKITKFLSTDKKTFSLQVWWITRGSHKEKPSMEVVYLYTNNMFSLSTFLRGPVIQISLLAIRTVFA